MLSKTLADKQLVAPAVFTFLSGTLLMAAHQGQMDLKHLFQELAPESPASPPLPGQWRVIAEDGSTTSFERHTNSSVDKRPNDDSVCAVSSQLIADSLVTDVEVVSGYDSSPENLDSKNATLAHSPLPGQTNIGMPAVHSTTLSDIEPRVDRPANLQHNPGVISSRRSTDPDLSHLIETWHTLPDNARCAIMAMLKAAKRA